MLHEIMELIRSQDPILFIILAFLLLGWVIIFERIIIMQFIYRINFSKFNAELKKMVAAGDIGRAKALCKATKKVGLPNIAAKALETYEVDAMLVKGIIQEETLSFLPRIRRRVSQVPVLASGAVLLGALAAINGVWTSYVGSTGLEITLKSYVFTKGMTHALIPLSFSMVSAIILLLPYGLLDAMADRLENEVEQGLAVLKNLLCPEQPIVAMAGGASRPAVASGSQSAQQAAPVAAAARGEEAAASAADDDVLAAEKEEPFLDEEEII